MLFAATLFMITLGWLVTPAHGADTRYWLVTWKEFGCDATCPESGRLYFGTELNNTIPLTGMTPTSGTVKYPCTMKAVEREERFDNPDDLAAFVKALNLKPLTEEMLDHPELLKWAFKEKRVVISEKDVRP